jgi:hypothetical protein
VFLCFLDGSRGAKGSRVRQRAVGIDDAQDASAERYLFTPQRVGIARAVPPFLMPADEQLCATVGPGACGLLLADDGMAREVKAFFRAQRARLI